MPELNYLPAPRSGFIEGKCSKCGKSTFSKGRTSKHRCAETKREEREEERR